MPIVNQKPETNLMTSDFFYDLPEELIAQTPIEPRDHSRLLCVNRATGNIEHKHFYDILDMLREGDTLVVNNSKVIPARLFGVKEGGTAGIETLLLKRCSIDEWEVLLKPAKRIKQGGRVIFGDGELHRLPASHEQGRARHNRDHVPPSVGADTPVRRAEYSPT